MSVIVNKTIIHVHGIDGYLIFGHNHTDAVHPGLCDGDSYVETDEEGVLW